MDYCAIAIFVAVLFLTTIVTWGVMSIHNLESRNCDSVSSESHQRTLRLLREVGYVKRFEALIFCIPDLGGNQRGVG